MANHQFKSKATIGWLWKMSWRDWKASRKKLYLIIASIVLGISAVVAIQSFGANLKAQIKEDSKKLMGADYIISSRQAPTQKLSIIIDSLGGAKAQEINFASMAFFPKTEGSKLVKVSGYSGDFPIYGELETVPAEAADAYFNHKGALVDATTMLQFDLALGDSVKIGKLTFSIIGTLKSIPGKSAISSSIVPPVFIPSNQLDSTGLLKAGSRVGYQYYFKADSLQNLKVLERKLEIVLDAENANITTHTSAGEKLGKAYNNFSMFLNLVAFTALLLGCLGIASATNIYIKEKKKAIAVLKCIGVTRKQTFLIYLFQIILIGLLGSLLGTALGLFLQQMFPLLLKEFLPVGVSFFISPKVIGLGIGLGVVMSVVFSLYPLISTWFVTPNQVLRAQEADNKNTKILGYIIAPTITLTVFLFSYLLLGEVLISIIFLIAIVLVFTAIRLLAGLFIVLIKKSFPKQWSFPSRQGLSNLFRPGNQTITLILCIGVGVFLINTLYLTKDGLINNATVQKDSNIANILLLDIQKEQIPGIRGTIAEFKQPVIDEIPVIAMKVHSINGVKTLALKADSTNGIKEWVLDGIFRASYRDSLISSEHVLEGEWQGTADQSEVIPISIGKGFRKAGKLELDDEITFNVQGVLMQCKIASIRNIEWSSMQMNFAVIFPKGVMEGAPQTNVLTTKAPTDKIAANLQRALVKKHPSVTVIDIRSLMVVVEGILSKIALVINFLALFSILTGFIVLVSAVRTSKFQRLKENAMLRTIGATTKQILKMTIVEYFFLGILGAFSGTVLSLIAGKMLAVYTFKAPFFVSWIPVVFIPLLITLLVVIIGVLNNLSLMKTSPKEILKG
jgi:putative ABC transport system permease protein